MTSSPSKPDNETKSDVTAYHAFGDALVTVHEGGGLGINVGGLVIVKPPTEWHRLACAQEAQKPVAWRWRPLGSAFNSGWIYNPTEEWLGEHMHEIECQPLYTSPPQGHDPGTDCPATIEEIRRIIQIEFPGHPAEARRAADRVRNFLSARIWAKTLAQQTATSVLPHGEGQAAECDGGLHTTPPKAHAPSEGQNVPEVNQMQAAIRAWLTSPADKRPSARALGQRIEEISRAIERSDCHEQDHG